MGPILFLGYYQVNTRHKMNKIANKFKLERDELKPEMHLWKIEFTDSACGPFTINKGRI